jgi:hypothetical protein
MRQVARIGRAFDLLSVFKLGAKALVREALRVA